MVSRVLDTINWVRSLPLIWLSGISRGHKLKYSQVLHREKHPLWAILTCSIQSLMDMPELRFISFRGTLENLPFLFLYWKAIEEDFRKEKQGQSFHLCYKANLAEQTGRTMDYTLWRFTHTLLPPCYTFEKNEGHKSVSMVSSFHNCCTIQRWPGMLLQQLVLKVLWFSFVPLMSF